MNLLQAGSIEAANRELVLPAWILPAWVTICAALVGCAAVLLWFGDQFAWEQELAQIPARWLAGGMMAAGLIFLLVVPLIQVTLPFGQRLGATTLVLILVTGFAMRLILLPSVPALEDDFYRYLWDGAVTAHGENAYALPPNAARSQAAPETIHQLAEEGALVLDRVNHPHLKTVYPPVAQGAFALAYWLEPWSLRGWRFVCLFGDTVTLLLLLMLLGVVGRSLLWVGLYWLNPLIVKELMNSAHMEAIVMPLVVGAVLLAAVRRPVAGSVALGLAIGAKLWPVMLVPVVLRPLLGEPLRLVAALAILGLMMIAWVLPPYLGGIGGDSGFVAYASRWQTNSALFQALQDVARYLLNGFALKPETPGLVVRFAAAALVGIVALWISRTPANDAMETVRRAAWVVTLLFFLSPAQFPWYASWVLIFVPFFPLAGLLGLTVMLPLYYVSFHFFANPDQQGWYPWVIRGEWLVIWALLAADGWRLRNRPVHADLS